MAIGSPGRPSLTAIEGGQSLRTPITGGGITAGAGQHALALSAQQHSLVDEPQAAMMPAENLAPEPVTVKPMPPRVEVSAPVAPPPAPPAPKRVFESAPVDQMEPMPQAQDAPEAPTAETTVPQAQAADDSFLAPAPARPERRREAERQPEPHAAAAFANGAHEPRRPSLFERMTGTGRAKEPRSGDVKERTEPAMANAPKAPQARPQPAPAARSEPSLVADANNRMEVSSVEDDVLDIPAFLRRQAN
jgi:cell division protein FtsZ